jgi:GTP 3',8-cyclase
MKTASESPTIPPTMAKERRTYIKSPVWNRSRGAAAVTSIFLAPPAARPIAALDSSLAEPVATKALFSQLSLIAGPLFREMGAEFVKIVPREDPSIMHVVEAEPDGVGPNRLDANDRAVALAADCDAVLRAMALHFRARTHHAQIFRRQRIFSAGFKFDQQNAAFLPQAQFARPMTLLAHGGIQARETLFMRSPFPQYIVALSVRRGRCKSMSIIPSISQAEAEFASATSPLIDPFGRMITYVRVSVTDRCDMRCIYCMSEDMNFLPKRDVLTLEELDRLCSAFINRGVSRLRLTGGEPLVRRGVMSLFRSLSRHLRSGALAEMTLTTNGSQLANYVAELADLGVRRLNVSVDTLDPDKFRAITRWGDLTQVMRGVDAAQNAGLSIKINMVALKGVNDDEFPGMLEWAHGRGMDVTLIEVMPLGKIEAERADQFLPLNLVERQLSERFTLRPIDYKTGGPARYVRVEETGGRLGFITPHTHNFCESCNRVRVTCTGTLYMCLGQEDAADLRAPLRASQSDALLNEALEAAIARKPKGHDFIIDRRGAKPAVTRHMSVTGG